MIPAIFRAKARPVGAGRYDRSRPHIDARATLRALIGIAGAIGAFGGVLVNLSFRQSFLATGTGDAAYMAFIAFYVVCVGVTWARLPAPVGPRLRRGLRWLHLLFRAP